MELDARGARRLRHLQALHSHVPALLTGWVQLAGKAAGYPRVVRVDTSPEFVSRDLHLWAYQRGVTLGFSRPGKPTDNAFAESFNGKVRARCPNTACFIPNDDARPKCEAWCRDHNEHRSHSSIGDKWPVELMNGVGTHGPPDAKSRPDLVRGWGQDQSR